MAPRVSTPKRSQVAGPLCKTKSNSTVLQGSRGKDTTKKFMKYHREALLGIYRDKFKVGIIEGEKKKAGSGGLFGFLKR